MSGRYYGGRAPRTRDFPLKWWQAALLVAGSVGAIAAVGFLAGGSQAEKKPKKTGQKPKPKQQEASSYDLFATLLHQSKQAKAAGDLKYAEEYALKAYEYAKQTLGEKSEIVGLVLFMLYDVYSSQHNLERAEWALLEAISVLKQHQSTKETYAFSLRNLADIYTIQERYKEAEPLSEEAATIIESIHEKEPDHENIGMALASLGNIKSNLGKYIEAEKAFKRALSISKKRFGYNNMITIQCILKYGLMLLDIGQVEEAEKLFKDTIAVMEKEFEANPDLPKQNTMPFLRHLADLYVETGNYAQAEASLLKFKEVSKNTGFEQHAHLCLETLYWQTGREEDAVNERNLMKTMLKGPNKPMPMTSSKYLLSKIATLEASPNKANVYHMKLQLKRAIGAKKTNGRELKLQPGSVLEFQFENPAKPSEPVVTTVEVKEGDVESVEVTSDAVSGLALHEFYEVRVFIYNNRDKETKLGVHHQLVRAEDSDVDKEKKSVQRFVM